MLIFLGKHIEGICLQYIHIEVNTKDSLGRRKIILG